MLRQGYLLLQDIVYYHLSIFDLLIMNYEYSILTYSYLFMHKCIYACTNANA